MGALELLYQAHPKDAEFLNKPIENYKEMLTIFGNGQATGKYAMCSNEALGTPAEFPDHSIKIEPTDVDAKPFGQCDKEVKGGTPSDVGNKRKMSVFTEEDTTVFYQMTDAVKEVTVAIRETKPEKPEIMHPDLYGAVMYMPGFPEEGLILA